MSQLESMRPDPKRPGPFEQDRSPWYRSASPAYSLFSTLASSSTHYPSPVGDSSARPSPNISSTTTVAETHVVVENWISKARESLADFDQFIEGIGEAELSKEDLTYEEYDNTETGNDDIYDDGDI